MTPWDAEDLTFDEARFRGIARLFPLPDLVMFPHVMQPLHIFEPRYLELLNHALDGDGMIAMSVPVAADGTVTGADTGTGAEPVRKVACLGRIVTHQRLEDGRYNLMLLGMRRIVIKHELPRVHAFREAEVELLEDLYPTAAKAARESLQAQLCEVFQQFLPADFSHDESVAQLLTTEASLGALTDLVSFAAPLPIPLKYAMLAECNVDRRARRLCDALTASPKEATLSAAKNIRFPPPFSSN